MAVLAVLAVLAIVAVGVIVAWPRVNPRRLDPVERVAEAYLQALIRNDAESASRLGTVDEPPGISSVRTIKHDRSHERRLRGSFAPLGEFHNRINAEYVYDSSIGRFTPKNPLGPAAETLDALHKAKEDAEKSGLYDKMQSGKPDDIFDAAEEYGKVFTKLAEGVLAPKKILPTYQMLVESAKPPLPEDAKALALEVAKDPKGFDALVETSVSDTQGGRTVPLRPGRGECHGGRPPGLTGRSAHAASTRARPVPTRGHRHRLEGRVRPPRAPEGQG